MTKENQEQQPALPFVEKLKQKQRQGKLKPSDFKFKSSASNLIQPELVEIPTKTELNSSELLKTIERLEQEQRINAFTLQDQAKVLKQKEQQINQLKTSLENSAKEKEALEIALFEKRLESLKQFSHYRERVSNLITDELTELDSLKQQNQRLEQKIHQLKNSLPVFQHPWNKKWMWFIGIILVLSLIIEIVK